MGAAAPHQRHLEKLRRWRNPAGRDLTLAYLPEHVEKKIARPHKHLGGLVELWEQSVPEKLAQRTALAGLSRGVLTVHVADSSTLYELDRLLRSGLEQRLRAACGTTLRKVKCSIATI